MNSSGKNLFLGIRQEFIDEESRSICPLLTPSPTAIHFRHPLSSPEFDRQNSPSSGDTEISSLPAALCTKDEKSQDPAEEGLIAGNGGSSSSSSCSVLQDSRASAQLLNYLTMAAESTTTEKHCLDPVVSLLGLTKAQQELSFVKWNWTLIRRWCFWGVMSLTVACVCVIVGYISTIPKQCDPPVAWHQGALIYQVFPPSFQDTDANGMGDIKGITSRISYLEKLGARAVRLSYVFPANHYPEHFHYPENLTQIDRSIGSFKDFEVMLEMLHRRNISLILDLPIFPFFKDLRLKTEEEEQGAKHVIVNNHILVSTPNKTHMWIYERGEITDILLFWLNIGVDGFYLEGLDHFLNDEIFIPQVVEWRSMLDKYNQGSRKILICSEDVVNKLTEQNTNIIDAERKLNLIMRSFDLINVELDPFNNGIRSIKEKLYEIQNGVIYSKPGYPWIYWTTGGIDRLRLASKAPFGNTTMAMILTSMVLPGTAGVFYGDEIGLTEVNDDQFEDVSHSHQLVPMHWSETPGVFGFSHGNVLPWIQATPARLALSASDLVHQMTAVKEAYPSLYMNAMWKNDILLPNTIIRYLDENVLLIERSYPRRNSFLLMANLGRQTTRRDFSAHYYGGEVLLDTTGARGSLSFQSVNLVPGQATLVKLHR